MRTPRMAPDTRTAPITVAAPTTPHARGLGTRGTRGRWTLAIVAALVMTALLASAAVSAPATSAEADLVVDDETVYAVLDAYGAVEKTIVVDWLRVDGEGTYTITDPGPATSPRALEEELLPEVGDGEVTWELDVDGRRDFFYRVETEQALPVEIEARYLLDGFEMAPEDIAGKDGRLRIEITATNLLERTETVSFVGAGGMPGTAERDFHVPLLTVVAMDIDGTRFSDIVEEADMMNVSGSTMSYTFMLFPQGEDTAVIEMTGTDIEMGPIFLSAFPQMPGAPEIEIADMLDETREGASGLAELSSGHVEIVDGVIDGFASAPLDDLAGAMDDFSALGDGVGELAAGAGGLNTLLAGQYAYLDGVIAGIDAEQFASVGQLASAIETFAAGVTESQEGLDDLIGLLDGHIATLETVRSDNALFASLAADLAASSPGTTTATLSSGLTFQQMRLDAVLDGSVVGTVTVPGLHAMRSDLADTSAGLADLASGLTSLGVEAQALHAVGPGFQGLQDALVVLRDGGLAMGEPMPGLGDTLAGLQGVAAGLEEMDAGLAQNEDLLEDAQSLPDDMAMLVGTLEALRDGGVLQGVFVPGLTTSVEGLEALTTGLGDGVDEARAGEAMTVAMEAAAASYDTFLGKPDGAQGRVRFVMKLPGIQTPEE